MIVVCHNCELMTFDLIALYYRWPVQLSLNMEMAQWLHLETAPWLHLETAPWLHLEMAPWLNLETAPLTGISVQMKSFLLPRSLQ